MNRIAMNNFDYRTGIGSFTVQSTSCLSLLPRNGVCGQENLQTVRSAGFGSKAFVIDTGKLYYLNSNNEWQERPFDSVGQGGDCGEYTVATKNDIDNLF